MLITKKRYVVWVPQYLTKCNFNTSKKGTVNVNKRNKEDFDTIYFPQEYNLKRLSNRACPISSTRFISKGP